MLVCVAEAVAGQTACAGSSSSEQEAAVASACTGIAVGATHLKRACWSVGSLLTPGGAALSWKAGRAGLESGVELAGG